MMLEQALYTSCERGIIPSKYGFQFHAASAGMRDSLPELGRTLEALGCYYRAPSLPGRPSPEALATFPTSLSFETLSLDRAVLLRSAYVGVDYSDRHDNYFVHYLVGEHRAFADARLLPIETWRSRSWIEKQRDDMPMPAVALDDLQQGPIGRDGVLAFLDDERVAPHVPMFLTAVISALANGRRIILVDSDERVAMWIALASYSIPRAHALRLTFNTYALDPYRSGALIVGTVPPPDTAFQFRDFEISTEYSVFDFSGSRFTPVAPHPFAQLIAAQYASGNGASVERFTRFVDEIAPDIMLDELADAFAYWLVAHERSPSEASLPSAVHWGASRLAVVFLTDVEALVSGVGSALSGNDALRAFETLHSGALAPRVSPVVCETIEEAFLDWLLRIGHREASIEELVRIAAEGTWSAAVAQRAGERLAEAVRDSGDPERIAALLRLGERIDVPEGEAESLALGEQVIGPILDVLKVSAARSVLTQSGRGRARARGIAALLERHPPDTPQSHRLAPLLADPQVGGVIESVLSPTHHRETYLQLLAARARETAAVRTDLLRDALDFFGPDQREDPELGERVVVAIWGQRRISADEALRLLSKFDQRTWVGTSLSGRILDSVRDSASWEFGSEERAKAATLLLAGPLRNTISTSIVALSAIQSTSELRRARSVDQLQAAIVALTRFAPDLDRETNDQVARLAARRVIALEAAGAHARLATACLREDAWDFEEAYRDAAVSSLSRSGPESARVAATIFKAWSARTDFEGLREKLLDQILPAIAREWGQREWQIAESELGASQSTLDAWQGWREHHVPQRGLAGLVARFLKRGASASGARTGRSSNER